MTWAHLAREVALLVDEAGHAVVEKVGHGVQGTRAVQEVNVQEGDKSLQDTGSSKEVGGGLRDT